MDCCYVTEGVGHKADDHTESKEANVSLTTLVVKETLYGSVWAYALNTKSCSEGPWVADQMFDDMMTIGPPKERVIVESDHEASIVELQQTIAKTWTQVETRVENSKVGDSNSNGKIERAIRNAEGMERILRSALSTNTGMEIKLNMMIVPWLVRHAVYILTRLSSQVAWKNIPATHQRRCIQHRSGAIRRDRAVQYPENCEGGWQFRGWVGKWGVARLYDTRRNDSSGQEKGGW